LLVQVKAMSGVYFYCRVDGAWVLLEKTSDGLMYKNDDEIDDESPIKEIRYTFCGSVTKNLIFLYKKRNIQLSNNFFITINIL